MNILKNYLKKIFISLYPFSNILYSQSIVEIPFLCIITPIFDPALKSLKSLVCDLQSQTFPHFIHISVSNGQSPKIKKYLSKLTIKDPRFIYEEIKEEKINTWQEILSNIGKRRTYTMRKNKALRYMFIDADSSVASSKYFAKLYMAHVISKREIIITQTLFPDTTLLPFFPITLGRIDITNFTFSQKIAQTYSYPNNIDPIYGPANDFRYFLKIKKNNSLIFFPFLGILKNIRNSYKGLGRIHYESLK